MLQKIFKTKTPIIGMVHFPPLLGYRGFPGIDACLRKSLADAKMLQQGGVDAIIMENNYDVPHHEFVGPETVAAMTLLINIIMKSVSVPIGVNVLWNDYRSAFSIAKVCGAKFIRVPVFVDSVETDYGKIMANPEKVLAFRKEIKADDVAIFADIQVKHAQMLNKRSLAESAKEAVQKGADAIIITGKWTGDAPNTLDLEQARLAAGSKFPIFAGSGADKNNARKLLQYVNGIIIGTCLKTGKIRSREREVNLKAWEEKISLKKTREFMEKVKHTR
ncbi:BtpA/SgcQ family protein [Patescibacteria group bacterium]|nr:BtpA/SgcQ family protein [Patescibacteria group bacterium]MBU4511817.1 BtpA/SgcQ family protein [Patescibacteria group bacterium]MCG2692768.1 BtpA/SgcQ family protein [Candidatus Parcubacteria bacterium]